MKDYLKSSPDENSIRTYTDVAVCTDIPSINIDTAPNMLSQKNTEMEGKSHHIHLAGKVNEKRKKFGFLLKRSVTKIDENICEEDKNGNINGIIDTRTMRSFETFEKGEKLENSKEGEKAENSLNIRNLKNESQDFSMKISEDRNRNSDLFLIHRSVFLSTSSNLIIFLHVIYFTLFIVVSTIWCPIFFLLFFTLLFAHLFFFNNTH